MKKTLWRFIRGRRSSVVAAAAAVALLTATPAHAQRGGGGGCMGGGMRGGMGGGMMGGGMRGGMGGGMMGGTGGGMRGGGMTGGGGMGSGMMGGGMCGGGMGGGGGNTDALAEIVQARQQQIRAQAMAMIAAERRRRAVDRSLVSARRERMGNAEATEPASTTNRELYASRQWGRREAWRAAMAARRGGSTSRTLARR